MEWNNLQQNWYNRLNKAERDEWFEERTLCDASYYYFLSSVGGHCGIGYADPVIHKPICDFFQDPTIKRKAIFMPRGWLKTSDFTEWGSIWDYLQNNDMRIFFIMQIEDKVKEVMGFVQKQILYNEYLRWLYPEIQVIDRSYTRRHTWSETRMELPRKTLHKEVSMQAMSITQPQQGGHFDKIVIDDPVGQKHIESPTELEKVFRIHDNTNELLVNPDHQSPSGSQILINCTFWGPGDYGTYVQEKCPEFHWRIVPALYDPDLEDSDNIKWIQNENVAPQECNWVNPPEKLSGFNTQYYVDMMNNPEKQLIFWAQQMNNPRRAAGFNKFDINWLKFYHIDTRIDGKYLICEDDNEVYKIENFLVFGIIDPGGFSHDKIVKKGANNAILVAVQPYTTKKKFVLYIWAGRPREPSVFAQEIFKAQDKVKVKRWHIEVFGAQEYIERDVREKARQEGVKMILMECPADVGKDAKHNRIQALAKPMEDGEIYVQKNMKGLITEIKNYPNVLTRDLLDSLGWWNKIHGKRTPGTAMSLEEEQPELTGKNELTGY